METANLRVFNKVYPVSWPAAAEGLIDPDELAEYLTVFFRELPAVRAALALNVVETSAFAIGVLCKTFERGGVDLEPLEKWLWSFMPSVVMGTLTKH